MASQRHYHVLCYAGDQRVGGPVFIDTVHRTKRDANMDAKFCEGHYSPDTVVVECTVPGCQPEATSYAIRRTA